MSVVMAAEWQVEYWESGVPEGLTGLDCVRGIDVDAVRAIFMAKRPGARIVSIAIIEQEWE
jgi:hypothetical protein